MLIILERFARGGVEDVLKSYLEYGIFDASITRLVVKKTSLSPAEISSFVGLPRSSVYVLSGSDKGIEEKIFENFSNLYLINLRGLLLSLRLLGMINVLKARKFWHVHGSIFNSTSYFRNIIKLIFYKFISMFFQLITVSRRNTNYLKRFHIDVTWSPNSFPSPRTDATPIQSYDFVVASRLEPDKYLENALELFWQFRENHPDKTSCLTIYGEGSLRNYLCELAISLGIDKFVFFKGYNENWLSEVNSRSIYLQVNSNEAFGLSCFKSARIGAVVIAPNELSEEYAGLSSMRAFYFDDAFTLAMIARSLPIILENGLLTWEINWIKECFSD